MESSVKKIPKLLVIMEDWDVLDSDDLIMLTKRRKCTGLGITRQRRHSRERGRNSQNPPPVGHLVLLVRHHIHQKDDQLM